MSFTETKYKLMNCANGRIFEDDGWTLADPQADKPALVRAVYEHKELSLREDLDGFYKYANWLPIRRTLKNSCAPGTYKSTALASHLGLKNLYITFSGWFPKRGIKMETCSFKETEAYSVCARLPEKFDKVLVVSSAGNTARSFAHVCSDNKIPLVLSVPEDNISALWFTEPLDECVKIISTPKGSDYFDAIALGDKLCQGENFLAEGGAKNIARRDGMGTTLLSAVECIGRIPDAYFQAVGSGTGTIAVWENNLRLIEDGRFGTHKMRLYASQNEPFTIMYDSWKAHTRELVKLDPDEARRQAAAIRAKVLSNRQPPYSICGGLFDALEDSGGDMYKVTNQQIDFWKAKFFELEGVDIYSAAAVALASLVMALEEDKVGDDEVIMLNITGGGEEAMKMQRDVVYAKPDAVFSQTTPAGEVISRVNAMFGL